MFFNLVAIVLINCASGSEVPQLTQTVYGFLDFTTTIGNTVMVFSPQSSPQFEFTVNQTTSPSINIIETRPHHKENVASKIGIKPTPLIATSSKVQSATNLTFATKNQVSLLSTPIETLDYSEYALLSRQPEEFVEETFRLVNLKSRADTDRQKIYMSKRDNNYSQSTALLSKRSGVKPSSKYSQGLQSTSSVERRSKTRLHSSARVLKTITPSIVHSNKSPVESVTPQSGFSKGHRSKNSRVTSEKRKSSRHKGKRRNKTSSSSTHISSSVQITPSSTESSVRRSFRTKSNSPVEDSIPSLPPSIPSIGGNTLKLNRRPGRWQYKSSPKPKVNIRKASGNVTRSDTQTDVVKVNDTILDTPESNQILKVVNLSKDLDAVGSQNSVVSDNDDIKSANFVQTLNVEISTPNNFDDTYYEIATIKSPFVFQAGVVKKTRFLTITSTIERLLKHDQIEEYSADDGPLTENILDSTSQLTKPSLDGSITTLKPIYYTDNLETPELETITESFTFTQTKLKTQILPIIYEKKNETIQITLVQTYGYTSFLTVTQTVSPSGDNFVPSQNFKDFEGNLDEAGSEINLDLEFGDESNAGQFDVKPNPNNNAGHKNSTNANGIVQLNSPEQLIKPEIPQINLLGQPNSIITSTRPIIKLETVWESYIVPLVRGTDSILRTLSKSVGVVEKTEYVTELSTVQIPQMSQYPINPFYNPLLGLPQQQLITSTQIYETLVTATSSKILKLTFGAKTAFTTIFSTSIVPTAVTKLITATLPIQNSGSFPNFYPPPYPPFAYVG
ncbi:GH20171 [Drosophila grimshawi]|uniref:GH20171 n=2 Tax=Drosophila grimshawi TaxID=7222 RepID=B4J6D8_DROGR|nr:GH20171 [Drosophila grimshawi]